MCAFSSSFASLRTHQVTSSNEASVCLSKKLPKRYLTVGFTVTVTVLQFLDHLAEILPSGSRFPQYQRHSAVLQDNSKHCFIRHSVKEAGGGVMAPTLLRCGSHLCKSLVTGVWVLRKYQRSEQGRKQRSDTISAAVVELLLAAEFVLLGVDVSS